MLEYFLGNGKPILEAVVGVVGLICLNFLVRWGLRGWAYRRGLVPLRWQQILDQAFWHPFHVVLTIVGLQMILRIVLKEIEVPYPSVIQQLALGAILLCAAWFFIGMVGAWRRRVVEHRGARREDRATVDLIARLLIIICWIATGFVALDLMGVPITALVALGGLAGGGLAFAAKDVVGNFFGGVMLHVTQPFIVGDQIRLAGVHLEGTVEEIGWMLTQVRTLDRQILFIPNSSFSTEIVINISRQTHRPLRETLLIQEVEGKRLPEILGEVQTLLDRFPGLDPSQKRVAHVSHIGSTGYALEVVAFTKEVDDLSYFALRTRLLLALTELLSRMRVILVRPTLAIQA